MAKKAATQSFEVWSEGFRITGDSGQAHLLGKVEAPTFLMACRVAATQAGDPHNYREADGVPRYWGCRLFDNEVDARRSFG